MCYEGGSQRAPVNGSDHKTSYRAWWWAQVSIRNSSNDFKIRTLIRTEPCRQGAAVSFGSWLWLRERTISYRSGSRCRAPTAGRPRGYPESGWAESQSTTSACLARLAGNTWSGCSPKNKGNIVIVRKQECWTLHFWNTWLTNLSYTLKNLIIWCWNVTNYFCTPKLFNIVISFIENSHIIKKIIIPTVLPKHHISIFVLINYYY